MTAVITLYGVNLAAAHQAWAGSSLDGLALVRPRGRVAALLQAPGVPVDLEQPGATALAAAKPEKRRAFFDALVEDLAAATLHDAPAGVLLDVFSIVARLAGREELTLARLERAASAAYPADLVDGSLPGDGATSLAAWIADPATAALALAGVKKALALPPNSLVRTDAALFGDLLEALAPVLEAGSRAGHAVLAAR
jgi:hypothetical protein